MKIWIDGYEANTPQRLGSSQVGFELLKNLEKIDRLNEYTILLPSKPLDDMPLEREGWRYKILKPKRFWTRVALPLILYTARAKPDLFFSPTHYIPRFSPVKTIVTIFDLAYLHFPEMFKKQDLYKLKNWTKFSVENSAQIITISKSSQKDIVENYQVRKDKVIVAYPGYSEIFKPINDQKQIRKVLAKYKIKDDFIIYIGTIQPRKNLPRLMEAVARIDDLQLVVVGKTTGEGRQGWKFEETLSAPKKLGIEDRVIFTGFTPTEDICLLINGAKAGALPSLYEGFGITLLETMACGVPVITSNVSSLPEVVGSAGLLVDPYSVDQIEQAIRTIISDKKLRAKLSKAALQQVKKFSWQKMAKQVLKVFEEAGK